MNGSKIAAIVAGIVGIMCIVFAVGLLLIKALWAWTVPDLFPGAVQQGLVAGSISWGTAAKVALFVAVLFGGLGGRGFRYHNEKTGVHIGEKEYDLEPRPPCDGATRAAHEAGRLPEE